MDADIQGMAATREIQRRVRAVKNIRQITRAMELVAAAKMQRAIQAVQQSRRYAELAWDMLHAVTQGIDVAHHPLLVVRPKRRLLLILISSNRGLAGGFMSKLTEVTRQYLARERAAFPDLIIETVSVGKKGREYLLKNGFTLAADFEMPERAMGTQEVLPLIRLAFGDYEAGKYDAVAVAYTDFVSMLRQEPRVREILPLPRQSMAPSQDQDEMSADQDDLAYLYEPGPAAVLESLVPRLLEAQLYQTIVESRASEQAARMVAMRNATDAAGDLIDDLTLTFNQLRQSGITQELAEISAGRLALGV